ncbi:hypothetical protein Zmor_012580 [Zophobas morio]|uniref:Dopa decarboxylase n=1 Tax=Zophobas morio TaxID=2755281 RepID=A0AA38IG64_9CUCU|nr:hypothetical protein Zmor_012580 [Zophobas morio]
MNSEEFRSFAKAAVDYIADYLENIRNKKVLSSVEPGYLHQHLPQEPPQEGEPWQSLLQDVDRIIVPGLTHWHSPHFHAYYPTANSHPGIVGEILLSGLATISTDWHPDNVCVALEQKVLDWLAKLLHLPSHFLNTSPGPGGGLIQNAASDSTLIALLISKTKKTSETAPDAKLVAYTSEQSNSSVEKAGLLASTTIRLLPTDEHGALRGTTLLRAIREDIASGLTPCSVVATLGTTGTCAFDDLEEIGPICKDFGVWLHVDAAYAGAAFCCPEYLPLMKGVEFADSFCFNPHKWMLVNSDCSAMWFKDVTHAEKVFDRESSGTHFWQIPDVRRFRALKLWFVLRVYGVEGIRKHIRKQVDLAKYFEGLVRGDCRFEVCRVSLGLVCFRVKGDDRRTQDLIDRVTQRKKIFVMPYYFREKLVIRFVICSRFTEETDVLVAWEEIKSQVEHNLDG